MCKPAFPAVVSVLLIGGLFTMPATRAEDPPPITQKDRDQSRDNLKQIALAFHNCNDAEGALPTNFLSKDGLPLLSWRIAILPYVEETPLFKQFKLDEPWDSANNKKLIEKMPKIYAPVRVKAKPGETFYQVFYGEEAVFGPKVKPSIPRSFPDGTSNTGMVFEAGEPVVWTKPVDMPFNEKLPVPKLGGLFDGECNVAMGDGSVMTLKKNPDEQQLKYLIMPADGNPIDFDKLQK